MKTNIFIFTNIFFIFGVFLNNYLENISTSLLATLFVVLLFLCFNFFTKKYFLYSLFIAIGILLGIFISNYNLEKIDNNFNLIDNYLENGKYEINYKIEKIEENQITYKAQVISINNENYKNNKIYAQVIIKSLDKIEKGNILNSKEKLYLIKSSNDFDYKKYMLSNSIYFKFYPYNYKIIEIYNKNSLETKILSFRSLFLNTINEIYTKDESVFLGGILLGAREEINNELKTNFNNSGLTHFIAVSGFNITILLVFFGLILKYFPSYIKIILMSVFIFLFVLLVGDTAPVIRAAIMGIIGYAVINFGREGNILAIILLTASIMIFISPLSINYDISLHLSFFAVLGIVYTQKFFEKIFYFLPNILEIKTAFTLTLSALSFSLPIIILNFGQISLLSPIANILVAWTIPLAMLIGFLSTIVYFVFPLGGIIIGYLAWILLKWDIFIVNNFGQAHFAIIKTNIGEYKNYYEIIYFIILIFLIIYFRKKETD